MSARPLRVRLHRLHPQALYATVRDEQGRQWRLPAAEVDADQGVARQAWIELLLALPDWFIAYELDAKRVTLRPAEPLRLGEWEGTYRGWNHRGQANWHVIKHALHGRTLRYGGAPEDWPADPHDTPSHLRSVHRNTGCGVHRWVRDTERLDCADCRPVERATCLGAIYEQGWLPYDRATREALRASARDPELLLPEPHREGGAPRVRAHDETGTLAIVALSAFHAWSVSTYRLISRGAARILRERGELGQVARRVAGLPPAPEDRED